MRLYTFLFIGKLSLFVYLKGNRYIIYIAYRRYDGKIIISRNQIVKYLTVIK